MGYYDSSQIAGGYYVRTEYSVSTNIAGKVDTIYCTHKLFCRYALYINTRACSSTINGQTAYFTSPAISVGANTWVTLGSTTHTVSHTSAVSVSASTYFPINATLDGTKYSSMTAYGTIYLPAIWSASTISAANGTLGEAQTLTINRESSGFTHTLTYKCGGVSETIVAKTASTSVSFTPALSLASQNTKGTSVSVAFTITTYSGADTVGSTTKTISCTIPDSARPSCAVSITDQMGYADVYGGFIQGQSKVAVQVAASAQYGATIASYSTVVDGKTYTQQSFVSEIVATAGDLVVTSKVIDSRTFASVTATAALTVLPYKSPTVEFYCKRCNFDGVDNDSGEFISIAFTAQITSLSGQNTGSYEIRHKKSSDEVFTVITGSGVAYSAIIPAAVQSSYDIELNFSDNFVSVPMKKTVAIAFQLMDFDVDNNVVSIGEVATGQNRMNVATDVVFNKEIYIGGTVLRDYLYPVGSVIKTFNSANPDDTIGGTWTKIREDYDRIPVGSQVLYTQWYNTSPSSTEYKILGAYDYGMFDGLFSWQGVRVGYHREYKVTAQITTSGNNHIKMWFNNVLLMDVGTFSVPEYQGLYSSSFFKETDIILRPTLDYLTYGVNLYIQNVPGTADSTRAIANNITIHGVFASDKKMFTWERTA